VRVQPPHALERDQFGPFSGAYAARTACPLSARSGRRLISRKSVAAMSAGAWLAHAFPEVVVVVQPVEFHALEIAAGDNPQDIAVFDDREMTEAVIAHLP